MGMTLSDWLETRVDVAAARYDADSTTRNVVDINQTALAEVIVAMKILDARIAKVEAQLGFNPFEFPSKGNIVP